MDDWVHANGEKFDFNKYGWPAWYPTRSLEDWEQARSMWERYVFRGPSENVPRPAIAHSKKKARRKPGKQK